MTQELLTLCTWLKDVTVIFIAVLVAALLQLLILRKLQTKADHKARHSHQRS